ncbi:MAG TPA: hypothetical protein VM328_12700 [Fimbriimonadaceae bacterium]|nr:hypothetical protein [Fimbriimonadaceae bacterium]
MRRLTIAVASSLILLATAWAWQAVPSLFVNGKKSQKPPIVQGDETYVPLSALRSAGADVTVTDKNVSIQFIPPKGQGQLDAVEGVIGEFVANEVWRVKVHSVEQAPNPFFARGKGYKVTLEFRNITNRAESIHGSGAVVVVVDDAGKTLNFADRSFDRYNSVPPGGGIKSDVLFGDVASPTAAVGEADKVLITFQNRGRTPPKNIRIFLRPQ